jgi:two-component system nitrogen regulation sensor histidine kinase NtrY
MKLGASLLSVVLLVGAAAVVFNLFQRQLSGASFAFGAPAEVIYELEASLADQRRQARLDPDNEAVYRARFDELETTLHRLQILEHNRDRLARRYELILLAVFTASVVLVAGTYAWRQSRQVPRLARLQEALTDLAHGRTDIRLDDPGHGTIGRIASMIESTSRVMARDRQRLAALENLAAWQEAARRHAHEMRTPLTGARLELTRIQDLIQRFPPPIVAESGEDPSGSIDNGSAVHLAAESAIQELDRLAEFSRAFTSFARLPRPEIRRQDLGELLREFAGTFGSAWPNLRLDVAAPEGLVVEIDREMLRQVLVNLCDNSSLAVGEKGGTVALSIRTVDGHVCLEAADDGPGIPDAIRGRVFEPYTTTRTIGEGMGLGLAISRKIMLDHDGDLEVVDSDRPGAVFRLTLPQAPEDTT